MPFLTLVDVSKFYGAFGAVANMSLRVEKGEFVSLPDWLYGLDRILVVGK